MSLLESGPLRYYSSDLLAREGVVHGVFTRKGGVSPTPWDSLNVGGTVGDDPKRVQENRRRVFLALGCHPETIYDAWQVHGAEVVVAHYPRAMHTPHVKADAILTDNPGVTLFMRFADCVPVLLYDPVRKAAGLVHAGWQGTVLQAAKVAVGVMRERFSSSPADILAVIGPSIGPDHYEVGQDVVERVKETFSQNSASLLRTENGKVQFDLWAANKLVLKQSGVERIDVAGICTACNPEDWYSHRREKGKTGRFGALIALPST